MENHLHIGTSGWSYSEWKGKFYPQNLPSSQWLTFYAQHFNCIEINSSFYHFTKPASVLKWKAMVNPAFRFCVKMNRTITHIRRLKNCEEDLSKFFTTFDLLQPRCGPVLIQLPPSLKFNPADAEKFFSLLYKKYSGYSFALEVRHASWTDKAVMEMLENFSIAWVISQSGVGFPFVEQITAPNVYFRFHGPEQLYFSDYPQEMLNSFAQKIKRCLAENHVVWAFFNNTGNVHAIENATTLRKEIY